METQYLYKIDHIQFLELGKSGEMSDVVKRIEGSVIASEGDAKYEHPFGIDLEEATLETAQSSDFIIPEKLTVEQLWAWASQQMGEKVVERLSQAAQAGLYDSYVPVVTLDLRNR